MAISSMWAHTHNVILYKVKAIKQKRARSRVLILCLCVNMRPYMYIHVMPSDMVQAGITFRTLL